MESNNNQDSKEEKPSCCTRFRTSMRNAGHFLYNSDTKEVLGRTGISWAKILAFYIGFYAILAGFWATCMVVFIKTLDPMAPTMQKMFSMMKDNPGMNYEPFVTTDNTLIDFDHTNASSYQIYVDKLSKVYADYLNQTTQQGQLKMCSYGNGNGATTSQGCQFDMSMLGNSCTPANHFGYGEGQPCVLLRINRVFLWDPNNVTFDNDKCVDKTNPECAKYLEFNSSVPDTVRSNISFGDISVSCEGENDGDADNINSVTFYPGGGFPAYFYPYQNQPNYQSPIVMAQFDVIPGRVSMILCKIWTNNIVHDKNDLQGSIHFELFVR